MHKNGRAHTHKHRHTQIGQPTSILSLMRSAISPGQSRTFTHLGVFSLPSRWAFISSLILSAFTNTELQRATRAGVCVCVCACVWVSVCVSLLKGLHLLYSLNVKAKDTHPILVQTACLCHCQLARAQHASLPIDSTRSLYLVNTDACTCSTLSTQPQSLSPWP